MKSGCAGCWATWEFEQEAASKDGKLHFIDWVDFEDKFQKDFMPINLEAMAVNVLEMSAYFQGKQTMDNYLDQFQDLMYDSGYTNLKIIGVKFCRGLNWGISAASAGIAPRQPSDIDPEAWFDLAV